MKHPAEPFARVTTIVLLFAGTNHVCWGQTDGGLARTHFVAPDGDALWGESVDRDKPCSPQTAFANAQAGDTVYFRGGSYTVEKYGKPYQGSLGPAHSGTREEPITFAACPGERVVFEGKAQLRGQGRRKNYQLTIRALGNQFQSYIVFDGFHFVERDRTGFCGIIIGRGCDHRDKPENWVKGCVVRNCTFDGGDFVIGSHPDDNPKSADNNEAIRIEETQGTLIRNCRIWNIQHVNHNHNVSAIKMYYNKEVTIENCEIYRCSTANYDKGRSSRSVFRYNYVHDSAQALLLTGYGWKSPSSPNGYFMCAHTDCRVYHNVFANAGRIDDITQDGSHSSNLTFYSNTLYAGDGSYTGVNLGNGTGKSVYNNVIYGKRRDRDLGLMRFTGSDHLTAVPQTPLEIAACDHNQFGGLSENLLIRVHFQGEKAPYYTNYTSIPAWQASGVLVGGKNPGQGSLDCDPRFVDRSGKFESLDDFRLTKGSPCRGAGRDGENMGADVGRVGVRGR